LVRKDPSSTPVPLVLAVLSLAIGFPFFILSAGAPLLQKWFAQANHAASRDPYFLYAASNGGSIAGLLAYPFFFERTLNLNQQSHLWFNGYLVLAVLISLCVLYFLRPLSSNNNPTPEPFSAHGHAFAGSGLVTWARRMRWLLWSLVPSSLLLGVTSYVTTDIVAAPFFWVVPLAAYLLSFVIAFARPAWATNTFVVRRQAFLLLGAAITIWMHATRPDWLILPLHLIAFFATALVCHGQLAQDRPQTARLTEYYLWISVGGVLGGAFNALIAPLIFKSVIEYPLAIAAAAFLRPYVGARSLSKLSRLLDWLAASSARGRGRRCGAGDETGPFGARRQRTLFALRYCRGDLFGFRLPTDTFRVGPVGHGHRIALVSRAVRPHLIRRAKLLRRLPGNGGY
jgi:hypothetical protein